MYIYTHSLFTQVPKVCEAKCITHTSLRASLSLNHASNNHNSNHSKQRCNMLELFRNRTLHYTARFPPKSTERKPSNTRC